MAPVVPEEKHMSPRKTTGLLVCGLALAAIVGLLYAASPGDGEKVEGTAKGSAEYRTGGWSMGKFVKPSDEELRERLDSLQYQVTQHEGTEPPFRNQYWDNHHAGIYVDVVSGEPLFSSLDKYESGTGWPSFSKPLEPGNVTTTTDHKLFMSRTEVRSKNADSHLGHVFDDGPQPTGQRYCMNSAAMRFIPVEDLEAEGYGRYRSLFELEKP